jgi:hypothetical protein
LKVYGSIGGGKGEIKIRRGDEPQGQIHWMGPKNQLFRMKKEPDSEELAVKSETLEIWVINVYILLELGG